MTAHHDPIDSTFHILDNDFVDANVGLTPPTRNVGTVPEPTPVARSSEGEVNPNPVVVSPFGLMITTPTRDEPLDYQSGQYPREPWTSPNVRRITTDPKMPSIRVQCSVNGFDPAAVPILWRLQCRYVIGRHRKTGLPHARYESHVIPLEMEWQGRSTSANFTLFAQTPDPNVQVDFDSEGGVLGGQAILTVMARPPGSDSALLDYVHLRFTGTNPSHQAVADYIEQCFSGRDANIVNMMKGIFEWEAGAKQFDLEVQTHRTMKITGRAHRGFTAQPDCHTLFNYPHDPAFYPRGSFDYGIGISQYTILSARQLQQSTAWNWRSNLRSGMNIFLAALVASRAEYGSNWLTWARDAWSRYNGSVVPTDYAVNIRSTTSGQLVSSEATPAVIAASNFELVAAPEETPTPPAWPPAA